MIHLGLEGSIRVSTISALKRCAFSMSVFVLSGCGGARSQNIIANAIPQLPVVAANSANGRSWGLPETKSEDLLYVSDDSSSSVNMYSYPKGKLVGSLTGFQFPGSMCPDSEGNVWITNFRGDTIVEYAHGGTQRWQRWRRFFGHEIGLRYVMTSPVMPPFSSAD
jgi:hypothetical protein